MRRASIDTINAKYGRGGATSVRPVVNAQPIATSAVVRAPVVSSIQGGYVTGGLNRSAAVGVASPVYQAAQHPPVYEVVTTPTKVYEIVTPIIDVNQNEQVEVKDYQAENQRLYAKSRKSCCPWWCWLLLCLLLVGLLIAGLLYFFKKQFGLAPAADGQQQNNNNSNNDKNDVGEAKTGGSGTVIDDNSNNNDGSKDQVKELSCKQGTHLVGGKCLSCPDGATWNGKNCIKKVKQTKTVTETVPVSDDQQSKDGSGSQQQFETKQPSQNNNQKDQKVDHHHLSYYF